VFTAPPVEPGAAIAKARPISGTLSSRYTAIRSSWCCMYSKDAPSGARTLTRMFERSSSGASSLGSDPKESRIASSVTPTTGKASQRTRRKASRELR
jgi:hypothetical protein